MEPLRVEFLRLADWEDDVVGVWLAENDDWLLLRRIPVDYVVDGYALVAKQYLMTRQPGAGRKQTELVLRLKGIQPTVPPGFSFSDTLGLLRWVEQTYGLVQFQDEEEATFLGWLRCVEDTRFRIDALSANGRVDRAYEAWFAAADVQIIEFDTDYFNSLKLLWQERLRRQWKLTSN